MTAGGWLKQYQRGSLATAHHPSWEGLGLREDQGSPTGQDHQETGPLLCQTGGGGGGGGGNK